MHSVSQPLHKNKSSSSSSSSLNIVFGGSTTSYFDGNKIPYGNIQASQIPISLEAWDFESLVYGEVTEPTKLLDH